GISRAFILLIVVLWAAPLTKNIPLAGLAGIVLKMGIDIIDWKFLKRAHRLSIKAAVIMYGVMLLTVFYDLITAVSLGVCMANILTIQHLTDIQSALVKTIDTPDDKTILCDTSRRLMKKANKRIMLLDLSGPMSFGAAKAITQRQAIIDNYDALIIDLNGVPLLGVTATLAIEKMIDEAAKKSIEIYIVGANIKIKERLQKFDIFRRIPLQNRFDSRVAALHLAVAKLEGEGEILK
ncbi:MAG: STAS domain-containing protein, partial [cyanobacterium endosymbiont of Rhopalodia yunnanensis]